MSVRGEVVLDLGNAREDSGFDSSIVRKALSQLEYFPDRIRVIIDLRERQHVPTDVLWHAHPHHERLEIVIRGNDIEAVARAVRGVRTGSFDSPEAG